MGLFDVGDDDAVSERARRLEDIFDMHADALFYRDLES